MHIFLLNAYHVLVLNICMKLIMYAIQYALMGIIRPMAQFVDLAQVIV